MPDRSKDMIDPVNSRVLIALRSKFKHLRKPTEERFGTSKTRGIVIAIAPDIAKDCKEKNINVGNWVYFGKYEDTAPYMIDGEEHVLLKLEDIAGRGDAD